MWVVALCYRVVVGISTVTNFVDAVYSCSHLALSDVGGAMLVGSTLSVAWSDAEGYVMERQGGSALHGGACSMVSMGLSAQVCCKEQAWRNKQGSGMEKQTYGAGLLTPLLLLERRTTPHLSSYQLFFPALFLFPAGRWR